jgi:hypothetical protein
LVPHRIGEGFVVDGRLRLDAGSSERLEDADEAAVLRGRVPTCGSVTAREDSDRMTERGGVVRCPCAFSRALATLFISRRTKLFCELKTTIIVG